MSRNGYALAIAGMIAALPVSAQTNHALLCDGRHDYLAAQSFVDVVNDFTIEAWINPTQPHQIDRETTAGVDGIAGQRYVLYPLHGTYNWGKGHAGVGISVGTNGVSVYEHAADYMPALLVHEGSISGWTHLAVVYRDRTPSLYINGVLVRTGLRSPIDHVHPTAGAKPTYTVLGGIGGGNYGYFAGMIDDVRIWNRPLPERQIVEGMQLGAIPGARNLVVNFDMNREGAGSGLQVANAVGKQSASLQSASAAAVTYGTRQSPVFVPREHVMPVKHDVVDADIAMLDRKRILTLPGENVLQRHTIEYPGMKDVSMLPSQESQTRLEKSVMAAEAAGVLLEQNVPNPVSSETVIRFTIPTESAVRLALFDESGTEVMVLADAMLPSGRHERRLSVALLPASGAYFYTLTAAGRTLTRSLQVVK